MDLSARDIDRIRTSYIQLSFDLQRAGDIFYEELFELEPHARDLFVKDIASQSVKLMSTLGLVVSQLQNTHDLALVARDLALRHLAYGVQARHYGLVRIALLSMLKMVLTDDNKAETIAAWERAYDGLAQVMIEAAYPDETTALL